MTSIEMKQILEAGGIRTGEAAQLFRVATSTAIRWLKGGTNPKQVVTFEIACKMCGLVARATERGLLPVKDSVGKARLTAIRAAIREVAGY